MTTKKRRAAHSIVAITTIVSALVLKMSTVFLAWSGVTPEVLEAAQVQAMSLDFAVVAVVASYFSSARPGPHLER